MNYRSKEFRDLKDQWYQKLKDSGFEDIEDTQSEKEFLNVWHSNVFQIEKTTHNFQSKQSYYYDAAHALEIYRDCPLFFTDPSDQLAWELHCNGISLRNISKELNKRGYKTNKDLLNKVINKFKKLIRVYE